MKAKKPESQIPAAISGVLAATWGSHVHVGAKPTLTLRQLAETVGGELADGEYRHVAFTATVTGTLSKGHPSTMAPTASGLSVLTVARLLRSSGVVGEAAMNKMLSALADKAPATKEEKEWMAKYKSALEAKVGRTAKPGTVSGDLEVHAVGEVRIEG